MNFNFVCQVDRLNVSSEGRRHYALSSVNFDCFSSYDEEQQWIRKLAQAEPHIDLVSYPESLNHIAMMGCDVAQLKESGHFDEDHGCVMLSSPNKLLSQLYVSVLAGKRGLGTFEELADKALQNQHLYVQFIVEAGFPLQPNNPLVQMPVTFEMFCEGTHLFASAVKEVGLVRRHIP